MLGAATPTGNILDALLHPVYTGVARSAVEEIEMRWGPLVLGALAGWLMFDIWVIRRVAKRIGI